MGYGTWQAAPGEVGNGVYEALKIGYRHLVSDPDDRWTLKVVGLQLDPEQYCTTCSLIGLIDSVRVLLTCFFPGSCQDVSFSIPFPPPLQQFFRRCPQCGYHGTFIPTGDISVEVKLGCPSVRTFKELWPLLHILELRMLTNIFRTNQLREPEGGRRRHQACLQGYPRPQA